MSQEAACPKCQSPVRSAGARMTCRRCRGEFRAAVLAPTPAGRVGPPRFTVLVGGLLLSGLAGAAVAGGYFVVRAEARPVTQAEPAPPLLAVPNPPRPAPEPPRVPVKQPTPPTGPGFGPAFPLPDPPKGPTVLVAKARDVVPLDLPTAAVRAVRIAHAAPPVVAVLWRSFDGFRGKDAQDAVDVYSLATGVPAGRVEFPADGFPGPRPFDLSPDGNRVAVEHPAGRVTVHDLDRKAAVLDGIEPFPGAKGLAAVRFFSPDRLAVFDRGGGVVIWDLTARRPAVTGGPIGGQDSLAAVSEVVGEGVFVGTRGAVTAVSLTTGKPVGSVRLPGADWVPLAVGADPLGRRLAVAVRGPGGEPAFALVLLPAAEVKGGVTRVVPLPAAAGAPVGVDFFGEAVVVRTEGGSAGVLYDLEAAAPVGYLKAPGPAVQVPDPAAGRYRWVIPDPANGSKAALVGAELPFDGYFPLAAAARAARKPVFLELRPDGLGK